MHNGVHDAHVVCLGWIEKRELEHLSVLFKNPIVYINSFVAAIKILPQKVWKISNTTHGTLPIIISPPSITDYFDRFLTGSTAIQLGEKFVSQM